MLTAQCPACSAAVDVKTQPDLRARLTCSGCGTALEVVWLYPLVLDFLEERAQERSPADTLSTLTEPVSAD